MSSASDHMACHECDLLVRIPTLGSGQKAFCPRCNHLLTANIVSAHTRIFSLSSAGLIFLILSAMFPFIGFSAKGQEHNVTLLQSIGVLVSENFTVLAVLIFMAVILIPAVFLAGILYSTTALTLRRRMPGVRRSLRFSQLLLPWSMAEIFLIGVLVSFIKIVTLAEVTLGYSFWAYVLFSLCLTAVAANLDKRQLWRSMLDLYGR